MTDFLNLGHKVLPSLSPHPFTRPLILRLEDKNIVRRLEKKKAKCRFCQFPGYSASCDWLIGNSEESFSLKVFLTTTFNFPSPVRSIIFVWLAVTGLAEPRRDLRDDKSQPELLSFLQAQPLKCVSHDQAAVNNLCVLIDINSLQWFLSCDPRARTVHCQSRGHWPLRISRTVLCSTVTVQHCTHCTATDRCPLDLDGCLTLAQTRSSTDST